MRRLLLPLVLGCAVLLSPIASRSSAPEPTLREGLVLPLPGQLNRELMVNDNNPEVVSDSGILLSTFAAQGKAHPGAHLDVPLSGSFELFSHHVFAGKGQAPNSTLWLAVVVGNRSSQPVPASIPSGTTAILADTASQSSGSGKNDFIFISVRRLTTVHAYTRRIMNRTSQGPTNGILCITCTSDE